MEIVFRWLTLETQLKLLHTACSFSLLLILENFVSQSYLLLPLYLKFAFLLALLELSDEFVDGVEFYFFDNSGIIFASNYFLEDVYLEIYV